MAQAGCLLTPHQLRELWERATKGEWRVEMGGYHNDCPHILSGTQLVALLDAHESDRPTAEAIVAMHNALPSLLERLESAESALHYVTKSEDHDEAYAFARAHLTRFAPGQNRKEGGG